MRLHFPLDAPLDVKRLDSRPEESGRGPFDEPFDDPLESGEGSHEAPGV
jgi:hypothetical protein